MSEPLSGELQGKIQRIWHICHHAPPCNSYQSGLGMLYCNGDMVVTGSFGMRGSITVNAYGSPDYNIYPHIQLLVNGAVVAEWDVTGSSRSFTYTPTHYYVSDHIGSATVIASEIGTTESEQMYFPYGGERWMSGTDPNHYKFTGKERDAETNLDYFGARYFNSSPGRFMSPDWSAAPTAVPYTDFSDPQTLNFYGYVRNNPLGRVDFDGHCDICRRVIDWITSNHSSSRSESVAVAQKTESRDGLSATAKVGVIQDKASVSYGRNTGLSGEGKASAASATINEGSHSTTQVDALTVKVNAGANVSLGGNSGYGVGISAGANASVISASQTETIMFGPLRITGEATGNVGIGASASGSISTKGISSSASLTPGYGGGISLSIDWSGNSGSGGVSVKGTGEGTTTKIDKPEIK